MVFEDFTTFTEVDAAGSINVAPQQIDYLPVDRNFTSYVWRDDDPGHYGNYLHYIDCMESSGHVSVALGMLHVWGVSNTLGGFVTWTTGQTVYLYMNAVDAVKIAILDSGNSNTDNWCCADIDQRYYLSMERNGTLCTCKTYGDAAHTDLLRTITITGQSTTFRYLYAGGSRNTGHGGRDFYGYVYNLNLNEGSTGIKIWDGTADIELTEDDTSPVKIRTPSATIGVRLVGTGHADASAIRIFDGAATKAFKKKV